MKAVVLGAIDDVFLAAAAHVVVIPDAAVAVEKEKC